jgi:hypothetical protein
MAQQIALEIVGLYPYVEYMKYLLAGSVAPARYVAVMLKMAALSPFVLICSFWSSLASPRQAIVTPVFKRTL